MRALLLLAAVAVAAAHAAGSEPLGFRNSVVREGNGTLHKQPYLFTASICTDTVNCLGGCKEKQGTANDCPWGNCVWQCNNTAVKPCFDLRAYPIGSNCTGAPLFNRANFCDECKGNESSEESLIQHRRCNYAPGTNDITSVDFLSCAAQAPADGTCEGCDEANPAVTFPLNKCVEYSGYGDGAPLLWRLENVEKACRAMVHKCWFPDNGGCRPSDKVNYQDRIVLDRCNNGWKFTCPRYDNSEIMGDWHP
jgi:hypothetical protein